MMYEETQHAIMEINTALKTLLSGNNARVEQVFYDEKSTFDTEEAPGLLVEVAVAKIEQEPSATLWWANRIYIARTFAAPYFIDTVSGNLLDDEYHVMKFRSDADAQRWAIDFFDATCKRVSSIRKLHPYQEPTS